MPLFRTSFAQMGPLRRQGPVGHMDLTSIKKIIKVEWSCTLKKYAQILQLETTNKKGRGCIDEKLELRVEFKDFFICQVNTIEPTLY